MAYTLLNASGAQWGVLLDETGLNVESVSVNAKPEYKEPLHSRDNSIRDFSVGSTMRSITVKGERLSTTTPFVSNFHTAVSLTNSVAAMDASGAIYLDEVTDDQGRAKWRDYEAKMSSYAGIGGSGGGGGF